MSVAESIVIFRPMRQVGWRSAASGVTPASDAVGSSRNGPPEAVRMMRVISSRRRPCRHW